MWIKRSTLFITGLSTDPRARSLFLGLYYLAILFGLLLIYGKGDFSTPPFVYQGF